MRSKTNGKLQPVADLIAIGDILQVSTIASGKMDTGGVENYAVGPASTFYYYKTSVAKLDISLLSLQASESSTVTQKVHSDITEVRVHQFQQRTECHLPR